MDKSRFHSGLFSLGKILSGSFLLAFGINQFLVPARMTTGGMGGIATIFYYLFEIPLWATVLFGNLVLFAIGFPKIKFSGLAKSIFGILSLSLFLSLTEAIPPFTHDPFAAAVFGGVLEGVGVGLTVLPGGSTGGSDFAALLLHRRFPFLSVGSILLVIDTAVILLSGFLFEDITLVLYSVIALFLSSRVMDLVLVKGDFAKAVLIISQKANTIKEEILSSLERGVTEISTRGGFRGEEQTTLLCITRPRQIPRLLVLVQKYDPKAFLVVLDVRQVRGEGFEKQ